MIKYGQYSCGHKSFPPPARTTRFVEGAMWRPMLRPSVKCPFRAAAPSTKARLKLHEWSWAHIFSFVPVVSANETQTLEIHYLAIIFAPVEEIVVWVHFARKHRDLGIHLVMGSMGDVTDWEPAKTILHAQWCSRRRLVRSRLLFKQAMWSVVRPW